MPKKTTPKRGRPSKVGNPFEQIEKETEKALRSLKIPVGANTLENVLSEMYSVSSAILNDPLKLLDLCQKAEKAEILRLQKEIDDRFEAARRLAKKPEESAQKLTA